MFRSSSCKKKSPIAKELVIILVYLSVTPYLAIVSSSLLSRPSHSASSFNRKPTLNHTSEPEQPQQLPATITNPPHPASNDNSAAPTDWPASGMGPQTGTNPNDGSVSIESPARTLNLDQTQLDELGRSRNDMSTIEDDLVNQIISKERIAGTGSLDQRFDTLPTQTIQTQDAGRVYEPNDVDNVTDEITVASFTLPSQPELSLSQQVDVDDSRIPYDVFPQQYLTPAGDYKSSRLVESTPSYPEKNYTLSMIRPQRHSEPPLLQTAKVETVNKTQEETSPVAVESTQVQFGAPTNKSALNAEGQNQANHQQELGQSSPPVGQARGGNIQARSMYSSSSSSASKSPHTRPPYATYDQFSQRSSAVSSNPDPTGDQIGQRLTSRNALPPKAGLHDELQQDQPAGFPGNDNGKKSNSSSSQNVVSQIQNSLDRISSELSGSGGSTRVNSKAQFERAQQQQQRPSSVLAEDKVQLQKLASVNQLVELSPIATDLAYAENVNLPTKINPESEPESMLPGYYPKPLNQLLGFYPQAESGQRQQTFSNNQQGFPNRIHLGHHNDRYGSHSSSEAQQAEFVASYMDQSALTAEQVKNQDEKGGSNQNKADSSDLRYYELPNAHSETDRKSTEGVSHAKLQATKHESPYRNKDFFKDHQERNGMGSQQQHPGSLMRPSDGTSNKHYAASFINVTGPMVPPLSATEAMESAVASQAGGKGILHQLSGFLRATQSPTVSSSDHQMVGSTDRPQQPQHGQSLYYMPSSQGQMQSIYSQPANQFSPQPPNQSEESLQAASQNATSAEERTRLDRTDFMMASGGRSKPQIFWPTASTAQPNISTTTIHQASGFRSPMPQSGHYPSAGGQNLVGPPSIWPATRLPLISNYLAGSLLGPSFAPNGIDQLMRSNSTPAASSAGSPASNETSQQVVATSTRAPPTSLSVAQVSGSTTNGFITGGALNLNQISNSAAGEQPASPGTGNSQAGLNRRVFNLTRVEHISAECSNDLIRTVIIFNGTFKGIIYSSGYVRDPNCMYINGTGKTRYDFSIRLNQCGTLGRQEVHPSNGPNEVRRRDQVMWNTLSIQYNPIVEQEWDEHFRVSCEYGSDFWKTVSFSPFNVETNTGSPVVFTVDPPQCQMEILRGHGMVGPRQEVVSGPVTVGDPLTLLIHMKSEKAGYDILVKNCIAHNGGPQKMQLIDPNGCVVNERFISPFRGTYNGNDMKHVTLYSYLKAFRFTGSPVLYLECEIHMCQSACPPQMCYWRRLSKRSTSNGTQLDGQMLGDDFGAANEEDFMAFDGQDSSANSSDNSPLHLTTTLNYHQLGEEVPPRAEGERKRSARQLRRLDLSNENEMDTTKREGHKQKGGKEQAIGQISDKVSLFQALEVRQEREPSALYSHEAYSLSDSLYDQADTLKGSAGRDLLRESVRTSSEVCYQRAELLAFMFTGVSVLLVAICISVGCCWRAAALRHKATKQRAQVQAQQQQQKLRKKLATSVALSTGGANHLSSGPLSAGAYSSASSSFSGSTATDARSSSQYSNHHNHHQQSSPTSNNHLLSTEYHKTPNSLASILNHQSARHKNLNLL